MKLRLWVRLRRFILVDPLSLAFKILIKSHFPSFVMIFLRNASFLSLERRLDPMGMWHYVGGTPSRRSLCLFWRKIKQRPELEFSDKTEVGEKSRVGKGTQRGQLAKRDAERQSRTDSRRDQSRWISIPEWTTVSRRRQWGRRSKTSWHS